MIIKNYEINKIDLKKNHILLFYGDNPGFKDEIIQNICKQKKLKGSFYYEKEILNNLDNFYNLITTKSFFEDEKIIIIKDATDKFKDIIEEIFEKKIQDTTIILNSNLLDKKSKLRNFLEKSQKYAVVACYPDNEIGIRKIIQEQLKEFKGLNNYIINVFNH